VTVSLVHLFFQAEDGIRDRNVTGVQTCALPISGQHHQRHRADDQPQRGDPAPGVLRAGARVVQEVGGGGLLRAAPRPGGGRGDEIGRASCRERGGRVGGGGWEGRQRQQGTYRAG